ncbi:MAG: VOC family protein [Pseudonocardia sp.]
MAEQNQAEQAVRAHTLLVIYTDRLNACRKFYSDLGLPLVREQHGQGPVHYAAVLPSGLVLELYPAGRGDATGRIRLGFDVAASSLAAGEHLLSDPDGRTVAIRALAPAGAA